MAAIVPSEPDVSTPLALSTEDPSETALEPEEVIRPALETFLQRFAIVRVAPFARNPELWDLMERLKEALAALPALQAHPQVQVTWSLGKGNWAAVPWIALLDRQQIPSTQSGIYGVFLFPQDLSGVYLALNQGVTDLIRTLGQAAGRRELQQRAQQARQLVPELSSAGFVFEGAPALRTTAGLAADYESSLIAHKFYPAGAVPSDSEIASDLSAVLEASAKLLQVMTPVTEDEEALSAVETAQNAWLWSPGQGASHWDELYEQGLIAIGWDEMGDLSRYTSFEQMAEALKHTYARADNPFNDIRACYDFAHEMRPDDLVFAKRGRSTIVGHGIVTGGYVFDPSRPSMQSVRTVRWLQRGEWTAPYALPMKTLTRLSPASEELAALQACLGAVDPKRPVPVEERKPFTVDDALQGLFMPRATFTHALEVWRHKRNLILQGAPGVGKSFVARRMAYALMGYEDPSRVRTVQFHQAYAYEDFVQGFRPNGGGFVLKEGVFLEFCRRALTDPDQTYVFIIDEINRGNLSKILGELMLLIEPDKRAPEWAVKLAYAEKADERFYVPPNVFLLGMMNTADRSLAVVDYALRRRFAFVTLEPGFGEGSFRTHLTERGVSTALQERICSRMGTLNAAIRDDRTNLGPGFCIGHSFFSSPPRLPEGEGGSLSPDAEAAWYQRVIETEVAPLLEEYWFDDPAQAEAWRSKLLA
nr:DUF3578 domain-containing protein [Roseomonas marmotae]